MKIKDLKKKLLEENPEFRKEYFKEDLAFGVSRLIANVRAHEGLSQIQLAKLIKTKQSGISRAEDGEHLPSLSFIQRIAKTLKYRIRLQFISKDKQSTLDSNGNIYPSRISESQLERYSNSTVFIPIKSPLTNFQYHLGSSSAYQNHTELRPELVNE